MKDQAEDFTPFVAPGDSVAELTLRSIILGLLLGIFFAVGNTYLGLKIGTTISASIPSAVLSMSILRLIFRRVSILENNIVQTIASVGEGLAGGIIFTIPALFLLGDVPSFGKIFSLALLGGVLGILFMIPMRRYIIVEEHGILPFPEGTACAEILKTGEGERSNARMAFLGILVGGVFKLFCSGLGFWQETFGFTLKRFFGARIEVDGTPSLLGVGYIIGPKISALMFSGGLLGWWVLIPLIKMYGDGLPSAIFPATQVIGQMNADQIWSNYIRYIGAGTVAFGGIYNVIKIAPLIFKTIHVGFKELFGGFKRAHEVERTDKDILLSYLILGSIAVILILWLVPQFHLNLLTIGLLVIIGYFFVAVTSITVGLVGSSSNPASGMTITTLLITTFIFLLLGWTERIFLIAAITMSAVVNTAITLASTTSQDLKTGYILGSTPWKQQVAELMGLLFPAASVAISLFLLNQAYGFGTPALPAPQATLMSMIAKGVILGELPWSLVFIGIFIGVILALIKVPILPFAIGLYLPLSLSSSIMIGGCVRFVTSKISLTPQFILRKTTKLYSKEGVDENHPIPAEVSERGILTASGLVAGDASMGVIIALLTVLGLLSPPTKFFLGPLFGLIFLILLAITLAWIALSPNKQQQLK
ncbi:MAG: hypothetical protein S4CHLAM102_00650 [Chlamydiia bacterium]|nr:hypothetical protein [Chlamydiia bacterium]